MPEPDHQQGHLGGDVAAPGALRIRAGRGAIIRSGTIKGNPTCIEACPISPDEMGIVLGTDAGVLRMFRMAK